MPTPSQIIQINLNHSAGAHELMLQTLAEWNVGLAIVSKPYKQINSQDWRQDPGFLVAIWGGVNVIGIYAPPSWPADKFENMLKEVDRHLDKLHNKRFTIVAGDFNAKSVVWGSKSTDTKGRILNEWSAGRDMFLLNDKGVSTCLRW